MNVFRKYSSSKVQSNSNTILQVTNPHQAKIAEQAGAFTIVVEDIKDIKRTVSIPVLSRAHVSHFVEAQILEAIGVDYIDEREVLSPIDDQNHIKPVVLHAQELDLLQKIRFNNAALDPDFRGCNDDWNFGGLNKTLTETSESIIKIALSVSTKFWRRIKEAVDLLHHVDRPSARVYSTLIAACIRHRALEQGRRVHSHTKASKFVPGIFFSNHMLDIYAKYGSLVDAQILFDEMGERDLCSWNTMIGGYAKLGRLEKSRKLFDEMPHKDNFSWNAAISGYVSHDRPWEALELFRMMQRHDRSNSNKFTLSSDLCFGLDFQDMAPMSLSLSHSLSRFKLKFSAEN
ncbi:Tetratricopeptide-like helical domain superfamily [Sesbania bispinosa]|nr:Tetratricopeptide-like helical domain superfamily [Sesbania bispinosa]